MSASAGAAAPAVPLERRRLAHLQVANGIQQELPALHESWRQQNRAWAALAPLPDEEEAAEGELEAWMEGAGFVREDLVSRILERRTNDYICIYFFPSCS